jgi:hypothetical protein
VIRAVRSRCAGPTLSPCPVGIEAGAGAETVIGDTSSSGTFGIPETRGSAWAPGGHEGDEPLDHSPLFPVSPPRRFSKSMWAAEQPTGERFGRLWQRTHCRWETGRRANEKGARP